MPRDEFLAESILRASIQAIYARDIIPFGKHLDAMQGTIDSRLICTMGTCTFEKDGKIGLRLLQDVGSTDQDDAWTWSCQAADQLAYLHTRCFEGPGFCRNDSEISQKSADPFIMAVKGRVVAYKGGNCLTIEREDVSLDPAFHSESNLPPIYNTSTSRFATGGWVTPTTNFSAWLTLLKDTAYLLIYFVDYLVSPTPDRGSVIPSEMFMIYYLGKQLTGSIWERDFIAAHKITYITVIDVITLTKHLSFELYSRIELFILDYWRDFSIEDQQMRQVSEDLYKSAHYVKERKINLVIKLAAEHLAAPEFCHVKERSEMQNETRIVEMKLELQYYEKAGAPVLRGHDRRVAVDVSWTWDGLGREFLEQHDSHASGPRSTRRSINTMDYLA
ncbi:hypothetical protein FLONG3_2526 [Fusarium longipes]|uniref:Uncharacterized protein n=1 Tax=Fusarium longipes TaxID=694270 RepID=A0A395T455_9HYPO|nr:hypothetical protein FLONG3_2526 [Fusarium longipes]